MENQPREPIKVSVKSQSKRTLCYIVGLSVICLGAFDHACHRKTDIVSRTVIAGSVNGAAFHGNITATINIGHGGHSSCTFDSLPPTFTPGTIGTHAWTSHHTGVGLDTHDDVVSLYEITGGNYRVHRVLTYPEFPKSEVVFDTEVSAVHRNEWSTKIAISGTYDGPTDVIAVKDYQLEWTTDGKTLFEKGSATLMLSSGRSIRSVWSSSITPDKPNFERFAHGGEIASVSFSPFKIDGNHMSYEWQGSVTIAKR
jgi:hypothetical protein